MASSGTVVVTAKTGPAIAASALSLPGVSAFNFDLGRNVLQVVQSGVVKEFDLTATTTVTCTISSTVYTLTLT